MRTRKCTKLFTENIAEYFAHVQAMCARPLFMGEGPGDKATAATADLHGTIHTGE